MNQATYTISLDELNGGWLERIKRQFRSSGKDARVRISLTVLDAPGNEKSTPLSDRFEAMFRQWKSETALLSSGTAIVTHPAYQEIIQLGEEVLPFILIKLREDPSHLFYALYLITGENPVPKEHVGKLPLMTADWLAWGEKQGYLPS